MTMLLGANERVCGNNKFVLNLALNINIDVSKRLVAPIKQHCFYVKTCLQTLLFLTQELVNGMHFRFRIFLLTLACFSLYNLHFSQNISSICFGVLSFSLSSFVILKYLFFSSS